MLWLILVSEVNSTVQSHYNTSHYFNNLGDNCIQNFHFGSYIVGYTVGNLVLQQLVSGAVKCDFLYIRWYTSPNENFEYGYPNSNALLQFPIKLKGCKRHKTAHLPTKSDLIDDVKLFLTVYGRIYCRKFLTLSNQTSRYRCKCIRIHDIIRLYRPLKRARER